MKKTIILLLFILLKFALQYWLISPQYDLHRDEFLHLDQAKHLAWGYESVPPLTSWVSYIILLLGNGVFWVKFFPALFGALTIVVVWKIIEELHGNLFAQVLASVAIMFSAILRINILYQPNSFEILSWTLFYFTFLKYIHTQNTKWLYLAAITVAVAFLNKYNIVFVLMGLLPAVLLTEQRKIFLKKECYISIVIALVIVSPNLFWQYKNHFPVFHHLNELAKTQLVHVQRSNFLKEQVLNFLGSIFIIIAACIGFFAYRPFSKYRLFFWSYLFTLVLFTYLKAKGYYSIGLYPVLLAFGAVYLEQLLNKGCKIYLRPLAVLLPVVLFVPIIKVLFPILSPLQIQEKAKLYRRFGLLRWEDGKDHALPQDFADMLGWHELANKVDSTYNTLEDKTHTLIICDNYGQAGAINYYSKNKAINAVSFNADYINWFPVGKTITNIILVKEANDEDKNREKEKPLFQTISYAGKIENSFAREQGTTIYLLKDATVDIAKILQAKIDKRKSTPDY